MLISHRYKFIFLKSLKTASTSLFVFLIPYCLPKSKEKKFSYNFHSQTKEVAIYKEGIIGLNKNGKKVKHVSALETKNFLDKIDKSIWKDYFKFTIVRNPWDLTVSYYFHVIKRFQENIFFTNNKYIPKFENPKNIQEHKENFTKFVEYMNEENILSRPKSYNFYKIKNNYICDYFIKYEELKSNIKYVLNKCNIKNYNFENLKNFRSDSRPKGLSYQELHSKKTKEIIEDLYYDDIEKFNYKFL